MSDAEAETETVKSRSARSGARKSYVDLTGGSDSEDEEMAPPKQSQKVANDSKRKRVSGSHERRISRQATQDMADLQAASTPPAPADEEDEDDELGEEEFEIDSIIDARVRWAKGKPTIHFRVHWKGYDSDEDSWTPAHQFDDDDPPVLDFYKRNPDKPSRAKLANKDTGPTTTTKALKTNGIAANPKASDRENSVMALDTPPVALAASSAKTKPKSTFLSFFGGKENRDPAKTSSVSDTAKTIDKVTPATKPQAEAEKAVAPPQRQKRRVEEEDSDFEMDETKADPEDDDDLQSVAGESEDDKEDDLESEHSAGESKPSRACFKLIR